MSVRVRIAPSPTGVLHIGTVRTALPNYFFAKKQGGKFVIRVEDTDKERSKPEYEENILEGLKWLGIEADEVYRQSEHKGRHTELLKDLVESGNAYISKEPSKNDPEKTVEVVRLKNPNKEITFNDVVRGDITFDTTELGDMVIARAIDDPLYHFAVVVDDHDEGITHIIRGEDHISNTPRQILIQEALGFERPIYAHLPLVLAPDRSKMSKRHGSVSIDDYRAQGFLKDALINFIAMLGWNPGTEQELFSMEELTEAFDLSGIQKGGAIFNMDKLKWFNQEYIKKMPDDQKLTALLASLSEIGGEKTRLREIFASSVAAREDVLERISTFGEAAQLAREGEYDFYIALPEYEPESLHWKTEPEPSATREKLAKSAEILENIDTERFTRDSVKDALWPYAIDAGKGNVLWPLRFALSGRAKSPDPFTLMDALGKEETLARIAQALKKLS